MNQEAREYLAADFLRRIENDESIPIGGLPYQMDENEWELFKAEPARFRKKRHLGDEQFWQDMKKWANEPNREP